MKLKIEIDMDNAAFDDSPAEEVKSILNTVVRSLYFVGVKETVTVRDSNGNTIGKATVTSKTRKK